MTDFAPHTMESAPEDSRELLETAVAKFGFLPNVLAVAAESPALLKGYMTLSGIFGGSSFSPAEQQIILLATSRANECHYCVAAHSAGSKMAGAPDQAIEAVREGQTAEDSRLEALRSFATAVAEQRGWVDGDTVDAFLDAGFSKSQALEVVLGAAVKMMSNYTNHIAGTPLDEQFAPTAWQKTG